MENAFRLYEIEEVEAMTDEERQLVNITSEFDASKVLRRVKAIKYRIEKNRRLAEEEIRQVQQWLEETNRPLERDLEFLQGQLEVYHRRLYMQNNNLKTIKLPHGTLKLRAQQPEFIRDDEKFLEYLRRSGRTDYIEVIEKPKWGEYKKVVEVAMDGKTVVDTQTGEIVEGVRAELRPPKFSVEV